MDSYNIDKYAIELIVYSLKDSNFLQIDDIRFSDCTYHIGNALVYTADAFSVHFQRVIRMPVLRTLRAEQFIFYALPICLKLSEMPNGINFLLSFSFLIKIVTCLCNQYNCFKFLDAAKKCLIVLIRRNLYDLTMWKNFEAYCRWTNGIVYAIGDSVDPIDKLCRYPDVKASVLRWMYFCFGSNEPFHLTNAECSILAIEDILDQEKENIESWLTCDFCEETCEVFAIRLVKTHFQYTRSINVNEVNINSRLFRSLSNMHAIQRRRTL